MTKKARPSGRAVVLTQYQKRKQLLHDNRYVRNSIHFEAAALERYSSSAEVAFASCLADSRAFLAASRTF